jgi:hypothetical protein
MFVFHVTAAVKGMPHPYVRRFDHVRLAIAEARALLASGAENISIHNNHGDHIEGSTLEECLQSFGVQNNLKPVKFTAVRLKRE